MADPTKIGPIERRSTSGAIWAGWPTIGPPAPKNSPYSKGFFRRRPSARAASWAGDNRRAVRGFITR